MVAVPKPGHCDQMDCFLIHMVILEDSITEWR